MLDNYAAQVTGVSLLAEPVRRALYEYVASQPEPVGRAEAAQAADVPSHTAKFHLDRLVEEGLLTTEFRRLSGRSGPGAGRPAKLYRRSDRQVDLTLPRRRYELAGQVLAAAVSRAAQDDVPVLDAVRQVAHETGLALEAPSAAAGSPADPAPDELERLAVALAGQGYEPRREAGVLLLANCPFHALAQEHRDLVCGMNLALLDGVVATLGCRRTVAALEPAAGRCCVTLGPAGER